MKTVQGAKYRDAAGNKGKKHFLPLGVKLGIFLSNTVARSGKICPPFVPTESLSMLVKSKQQSNNQFTTDLSVH